MSLGALFAAVKLFLLHKLFTFSWQGKRNFNEANYEVLTRFAFCELRPTWAVWHLCLAHGTPVSSV